MRQDIFAMHNWKTGRTLPYVVEIKRETEGDSEAVKLSLTIPADLFQLQGHFPEMPVLPGVAQLDWIVIFAKEYLGLDQEIVEISQLKFRALMTPGVSVNLHLNYQPEKDRIAFEYRNLENFYSSGFLKLSPL